MFSNISHCWLEHRIEQDVKLEQKEKTNDSFCSLIFTTAKNKRKQEEQPFVICLENTAPLQSVWDTAFLTSPIQIKIFG